MGGGQWEVAFHTPGKTILWLTWKQGMSNRTCMGKLANSHRSECFLRSINRRKIINIKFNPCDMSKLKGNNSISGITSFLLCLEHEGSLVHG